MAALALLGSGTGLDETRSMNQFRDQVAFISGAAGAIGSGLALACLEAGMRVALADIDHGELAKVAQSLGGERENRVAILDLDVRDIDSWRDAAAGAEQRLGPVRLLFNNAGVTSARAVAAGGGIENLSIEEWKWTLSVNLDGVFLGLKTFVPKFKADPARSFIINTSAMAAWAPLRVNGGLPLSYAASKAGISHMTAQLRTELDEAGAHHISVHLLSPGLVRSNIFVSSYNRSPGNDDKLDESRGSVAFHGHGIDPLSAGRHTLRAIDRGQFYIFTHGEWGPNVCAYFDEVRGAFDSSADPFFVDPAAGTVDLKWARGAPRDLEP